MKGVDLGKVTIRNMRTVSWQNEKKNVCVREKEEEEEEDRIMEGERGR